MFIDNGNEDVRIKPVNDLTFSDDFMFGAVMQNEEICKGVIERLLQIKIDRIEYPELQKTIKPLYNQRGVRLDVYVKDSNRVFDVECQTYDEKAIGKRVRYYQSMLDADSLLHGEPYRNLKESYILFLSLKDPFGKGLPVYTFNRTCKEDGTVCLGDMSHNIIFNCSGWKQEKNTELREFLSFVKGNGKANSKLTQEIHNMVEQKKFENTFINEYMAWCLHDNDVEQRGIQQGIQQGAASQKAEDEKLIAEKDAEIARLKELLSKK